MQLADEAVTSLTEALDAKSEYTRDQAIEALLLFGPKAAVAIPRIRALVNDPNEWVRSDAAMPGWSAPPSATSSGLDRGLSR